MKKWAWIEMVIASLSVFLMGFCIFCYGFRMDSVAAVTVFPPWLWAVPAIFLTWVGFRIRNKKRLHSLIASGWFVFIFVFSETPYRYSQRSNPPYKSTDIGSHSKKPLRIVSLNCSGGSKDAAREVISLKPDVVLLQEVPEETIILNLTKEIFGDKGNFVRGEESSILASGSVTPIPGMPWFSTRAKVRFSDGIELDVTTFRLKAPIVRADLWNPECWRVQKENRIARYKQLKKIMDSIEKGMNTRYFIMGGDFNAPAGDAVFKLIGTEWRDAFEEGGIGWGATMPNDSPLFRIDRVFKSTGIRVAQARTKRTKHSDHRALLVDIIVE